MRSVKTGLTLIATAFALAGCAGGGILGGGGPDEFAVTRAAPLVIPPDFALTPPQPGQAGSQGMDSRNQAIQALFGGPAPRTAAEQQMLNEAGVDRVATGARSVVGDPDTVVVDRGVVTQTILAAPEGPGREADVSTPD